MSVASDDRTPDKTGDLSDESIQDGYFRLGGGGELIPNPEKTEWVQQHLHAMENLLEPGAGKRLLDFGSGSGFYGLRLADRNELDRISIDGNRQRLQVCQAQSRESSREVAGSVDKAPLRDNSVDYGLCNHVLEHVQDDRAVLKELYRVLRPGGLCVVGVPLDLGLLPKILLHLRRTIWPRSRTLNLEKASPGQLQEELLGRYSHVRFYDRSSIRRRVRNAGFSIEEERGIGISLPGRIPTSFKHHWIVLRGARGLTRLIPGLSASLLLSLRKPRPTS